MPAVAKMVFILWFLDNQENIRVAIHRGYVRVPVQRTKVAREGGLALRRQILIAEKDDAMLEQRAPNVFDHLIADMVQINTCNFSAEGACHR